MQTLYAINKLQLKGLIIVSRKNVQQYFEHLGLLERIKVLDQSSATVADAAAALGCEPEHIAKTLSLLIDEQPILVVMAGDAKIDNHKYKEAFHKRAEMIHRQEVEAYIGHALGGVCPFAVKANVLTYLDVSLKRFDTIFPAAGDSHSAVKLSLKELEACAKAEKWVDVCKNWA
ncbi:EbsC protein [Lactobacillus hilgardii]